MAFLRRRSRIARKADTATDKAEGALSPGPHPATNLLLADIALRGGGALLKRAVETGLLGAAGAGKARAAVKGRSLTQSLVGTAIVRLATRSVPGALIVGGGLLAKTLYDRKRARSAAAEGHEQPDKLAPRGRQ